MGIRYKIRNVEVTPNETRRATWKMAGHTISGKEHVFDVRDGNYTRLNQWSFAIRIAPKADSGMIVQPLQAPGKKVWAGIERRSIVWKRATINPHKVKVYCKVNLADPAGEKTKVGLRRGERDILPYWFKELRHRLRLKGTVTTTKAHDTKAQVVLSRKDDYVGMIRVFFALKVWVLEEHYQIVEG